ncbi:uncharacterized protein DUF3159 [Glaciihabitans tibetensis]|uniref:Uncharacterized protein DUF3159 n=1 Tax=Glaciihabitans tibetensis TaxID=1266600 RepID=A0A2T0VJD6_9MICO|nr:DUF3159 domain-containing protein [Glaciihabitans tibetensis]PRY70327.1 uncharacterized protein DUF3159 [Glaciihabitans tibetensis]
MTVPDGGGDATPTFSESLSAAARQSGLGQLAPGEAPTAGALLGALGGVRGLIESVLPGFAFLLLFTITGSLPVSVLVPVGVAIVFVVVRAVTRSPVAPAVAGLIGIALTATLSLVTNRAENNFLPGIVINSATLVVLVVSILVRWPLVGIVIGLLMGEQTDWRADRVKRRAYTLATWIWVIPSAIRVGVQVPLYLAERADLLAATKLLTGIPLYLAALWVTWLLVRAVHNPTESLPKAPRAS